MLREFYCPPCDAWFDAFTKLVDKVPEKRTHTCGKLCETRMRPGSRVAIRGGEWNSVPRDVKREYQRYWKLTDNQINSLTREQIDRVMAKKNLQFTDAAWHDRTYGAKLAGGQLVDLPPETDDPAAVDEWNRKKFGPDFVQGQREEARAVFDAASSGSIEPLPEAVDVNVHDAPHQIDVQKTLDTVANAPVVDADRRRELQGRLVT